MLRIAVCDDELLELSRISKLLNKYLEKKKTVFQYDTFTNVTDLLETMNRNTYDILLLDVLMPGINGIQAACEIRRFDQNLKIIFLTSSPEFAVESYSVDAYYYLLKPATETKLFLILDKLFSEVQRMEKALLIKSASGITRIFPDRLEFIEVINKKLYFHLTDGCIKDVYGSMADFETKLLGREEFIKTHRSYIVNMRWIQELKPGEITVASGCKVPISRVLYTQVRETYMKNLFIEKGVE